MRKTALLLIAGGILVAIGGGLTLVSHHAAAVSQSQAPDNTTISVTDGDAQLKRNPVAEPIMAVGDASAGN